MQIRCHYGDLRKSDGGCGVIRKKSCDFATDSLLLSPTIKSRLITSLTRTTCRPSRRASDSSPRIIHDCFLASLARSCPNPARPRMTSQAKARRLWPLQPRSQRFLWCVCCILVVHRCMDIEQVRLDWRTVLTSPLVWCLQSPRKKPKKAARVSTVQKGMLVLMQPNCWYSFDLSCSVLCSGPIAPAAQPSELGNTSSLLGVTSTSTISNRRLSIAGINASLRRQRPITLTSAKHLSTF